MHASSTAWAYAIWCSVKRLLNLFRYQRGVCRYCECQVEPDETICELCWANNNAW